MRSSILPRLSLLAAISNALLATAQMQNIQWQRCLGGSLADEGAWVEELSDGSLLIAGSTNSPSGDFPAVHGGKDIWVARLSADGALLWQQVLGGSADEAPTSVHQTADGSIVVAGWTLSDDGDVSGAHGDRDAWIAKLDPSGQVLWQRALGGSGRDQANALAETPEGDLVLCGMTTISDGDVSGSHGLWDAWVLKLSGTGQLLWQRALGGSHNDWASALVVGTEGSIHVVGTGWSTDGDVQAAELSGDVWVFTLDASGTLLWSRIIGTNYNQEGGGICIADGGDLFISGNTGSDFEVPCNYVGNARYMAARLSPQGEVVWTRWLPGYHYDRATSIVPIEDDLLLFGTGFSYIGTFDFEHQGYDPMAYRISTAGDSLWSHLWGGTSLYDYGDRMIPTADGGMLFIGDVWSNNGDVQGWLGGGDAWVVKLTAGMASISTLDLSLVSLAPNPNNGAFMLQLPEGTLSASADLFDIQGRMVYQLPELHGGPNRVHLPTLADGRYELRVHTSRDLQTLPLLLQEP